jgi:hypothetical protein
LRAARALRALRERAVFLHAHHHIARVHIQAYFYHLTLAREDTFD